MAGETNKYDPGVHANYDISFLIDTSGLNVAAIPPFKPTPKSFRPIKDAEVLNISFDNGVEEWNPMDSNGWVKRLLTAKSIGISITAKRNCGDEGNDYIASHYMKSGKDCYSLFEIAFPNGDEFLIPCVINVTSIGGESTGIDTMEFEILSHGKPEYIEHNAAETT